MPETLSCIELAPDDLAALPAGLRRKIGAAFGSSDIPSGDWLLVGAAKAGLAQVIERAVEALPLTAAKRSTRLTEADIEKLLDVILADAPRAPVEAQLEIDNAALRAEYLKETPLMTAAEVRAASGLAPRNRSEPASRWKREGRLFAVRRSGVDLYPAFQLVDGVPLPVIKEILAALPRHMTGWQVAMWFASGNGWLQGAEPQKRLADPEAVIAAARWLADPAVG